MFLKNDNFVILTSANDPGASKTHSTTIVTYPPYFISPFIKFILLS